MRKYTLYIILLVLLLTACNDRLVFSEYGHTPVAGWEKSDCVKLDVDSLSQSGVYGVTLSLRLNYRFPFTKLYLNVIQTVYPSMVQYKDAICVNVADDQGTMLGTGVSYYQYDVMLRHQSYQEGDSVHFEISHNMKREILPGVSDVGISLARED